MNRRIISQQNEVNVRSWFELSGFASDLLDKPGIPGKKADWKFSKGNLVVICEVKTIFSGGQIGSTEQQWERSRERERKYLEQVKAQLPEGEQLLVSRRYYDYIHGNIPYPRPPIRKEYVYQEYIDKLKEQMENDPDINQLPFSVTININALYVPYGTLRAEFFDWLKGYILWAKENHDPEHRPHSPCSFKFEHDRRAEDGKKIYGPEAFVQIMGPDPERYPRLYVGFLKGGTGYYNQQAIAQTLQDAREQISGSIERENLQSASSVIAFWSASDSLYFPMMLTSDAFNAQEGKAPKRYEWFDWVFAEPKFRDLVTAIALFGLRQPAKTKLFERVDPSELTPFAYIILNPFQNEEGQAFQNAINEEYGKFIRGIDTDPLK